MLPCDPKLLVPKKGSNQNIRCLPNEAKNLLYVDREDIMGRINKCKLRWKPSKSDRNVSYRLYWSNAAPVGYKSNFIKLGKVTEVDLPDILIGHGSLGNLIYLGISAVDRWGNESNIKRVSEPYRLSPPVGPVAFAFDSLNYPNDTAPMENRNTRETELQRQAFEKTVQKFQSIRLRPPLKFVTAEGKIVDGFADSFRKTAEL